MANYRPAIIEAAQGVGIDASIALAVAQRESGVQQYDRQGKVKIGKAGEVGIFQIKPSTAPGVNLADPQQNIHAGVNELARLYRAFSGSWPLAIAAYNWGAQNVKDALRGVRSVPPMVVSYVNSVLGLGQLDISATGKLATVVGPQLANQAGSAAEKFANSPIPVLALLFLSAALVLRKLL